MGASHTLDAASRKAERRMIMSREYPCIYYDDGRCKKFNEPGYIDYCVLGPCAHETPSNADRIRAMSDEELADMLWETGRNYRAVCADPVVDYNEHRDHLIAWLKQPAEQKL